MFIRFKNSVSVNGTEIQNYNLKSGIRKSFCLSLVNFQNKIINRFIYKFKVNSGIKSSSFRLSWTVKTLLDSLRLSCTVCDSPGQFTTLLDSLRHSWTVYDSPVQFTTFLDSLRLSWTVCDSPGQFTTLLESLRHS